MTPRARPFGTKVSTNGATISKDKAVPYIVDFTMVDTDKDGMSTPMNSGRVARAVTSGLRSIVKCIGSPLREDGRKARTDASRRHGPPSRFPVGWWSAMPMVSRSLAYVYSRDNEVMLG